jgi:drug/metabolite transporter (DMT)-like permease
VVAAILGWLVFSERVTPMQGLGAAVLLAGVILAQASAAGGKKKGAAPVEAAPS